MASSEAQQITNPGQVAHLLKRLADDHTLLTVTFPDSKILYNSAILAVDPAKGTLELDELNPSRGHEAVERGSKLRVEARLQGVETRFVVEVREILLSDGIYYYRAAFPRTLIYRQRRQYHRVPVRLTFEHQLAVGEAGLEARIVDLSVGGFGGVVTGKGRLEQGEHYQCRLQLGDEEPILATVQLRFASQDRRGQQRFGAMFVDLPQAARRRIERMVMELERELRRVT